MPPCYRWAPSPSGARRPDDARRLVAVKSTGSVIVYTLLRLAVFIVPFVIFLSIGVIGPYAALYAAIIGLVLSLLFLRGSRDRVAVAIDRKRRGGESSTDDEDIEDAAVDAANTPKDH